MPGALERNAIANRIQPAYLDPRQIVGTDATMRAGCKMGDLIGLDPHADCLHGIKCDGITRAQDPISNPWPT